MTKTTEQLKKWNSDFGKEYTARNAYGPEELDKLYMEKYGVSRTKINSDFIGDFNKNIRILEVGSNVGNQLVFLQKMKFKHLYGVEPQKFAVEWAKKNTVGINIIQGDAFDIPFKDNFFDLVFTSGVLIHIHPKMIVKALKEICRCSSRYIWGLEYFSKDHEEIEYRGEKGLLWKGDFARIYESLFPHLKLKKETHLHYSHNDNIDTVFMLEKTALDNTKL